MSTSILYHGFGVHGYTYLKTEYIGGKIIFHIEKSPYKKGCCDCGSRRVTKKGTKTRYLRTLSIGGKSVFLAVHIQRQLCQCCGALKQEALFLSFPKKRWTKKLGRYVVELLRRATVEDVARHLRMSWDTVKDIHTWALRLKFKRRKIKHLKYLGVDEISVGKGHTYFTVVVDLETGQIVWVAEDRQISSLDPFLKRLKKAGAEIKAIAMDMWNAYISAVLNNYSHEVIVFDHYHVISDYNKMLDELRRAEVAKASESEKKIYVGVRYLLLKAEEKIEDNTIARAKLDRLLSINQNLNIAYILKEELRGLWSKDYREEAEEYLANWVKKAWASGIKPLIKFANKIASHRTGILNYFDIPISTGKVEGINNKIKVLKRQAYGYRDMEYFKLRIYNLHESRYALVG